jgi:hypothetical protein
MKVPAIMSFVPCKSFAALGTLYVLALLAWAFLLGHGQLADPITWAFSAVAALLFVSFGVCCWALLMLAPALRPSWLQAKQSFAIAAGAFALQGGLAGALAVLGAWPHPDVWYLGALPFLWVG